MGLVSALREWREQRRRRQRGEGTVLVELFGGGPLDGRRRLVPLGEMIFGPDGVEWRGGPRPRYVFETPPEPTIVGGEPRLCFHGRFEGWEGQQ
jgi:hypothetical protein